MGPNWSQRPWAGPESLTGALVSPWTVMSHHLRQAGNRMEAPRCKASRQTSDPLANMPPDRFLPHGTIRGPCPIWPPVCVGNVARTPWQMHVHVPPSNAQNRNPHPSFLVPQRAPRARNLHHPRLTTHAPQLLLNPLHALPQRGDQPPARRLRAGGVAALDKIVSFVASR